MLSELFSVFTECSMVRAAVDGLRRSYESTVVIVGEVSIVLGRFCDNLPLFGFLSIDAEECGLSNEGASSSTPISGFEQCSIMHVPDECECRYLR